jgi:aminoglycoside phosphotransferase (APT) family kinase protein
MSWPAAEVPIDAALVSSLLRAQFPEFANLDCYRVNEGFDNSVWRLGEELVIRLPRHQLAATLIENELRWLPEVVRHVSLATPLPLRAGAATNEFPWPWLIASWHDGEPGDGVNQHVRGRSAKEMANFLRAIHTEAPTDAPFNPYRSVALASRESSLYSRLEDVGEIVNFENVESLWKSVRDTPRGDRPDHWLHGDFHPGNTIYRNGSLIGVIDFGDMCAGDPAVDLAGGLLSLPYESLSEFFDTYERCDGATLRRTIGWSIFFGVMFVSYARDRANYLGIGQLALANAHKVATTL